MSLILETIKNGADVGYVGPRDREQRCPNLPSALVRPDVITADIYDELKLGRIAGPFAEPPATT